MTANLRKILLKLKQKFNNNSKTTAKIQNGPLKGFLWNLSITDTRYLLGNYESSQSDWILKSLKGKTKFADIGANAGYFSLLSKVIYPEIEVYLFEPLPLNIEQIHQHFKENNLGTDYHLCEVALSDSPGETEFSDSGNAAANTIMEESSMMQNSNKLKAKLETIDDNAEKFAWDSSTFLKIDIEGAEYLALKGGQNYFEKFYPEFILATHDCHVPGVEKQCLDFLSSIGYQFKLIKDDKITGQVDYFIFT